MSKPHVHMQTLSLTSNQDNTNGNHGEPLITHWPTGQSSKVGLIAIGDENMGGTEAQGIVCQWRTMRHLDSS